MFPLLTALVRPGRLLSGLALLVIAILMMPAWLLWPLLDRQRRADVMDMVDRLRLWAESAVEPSTTTPALGRPELPLTQRTDRSAAARSPTLSAARQQRRPDQPAQW
jgi:hypothetical protein